MPIEQTDDGKVIISTADKSTSATVLLYGATLISWKTKHDNEHLWVSDSAKLDGTKAVRGGVPLVFPVFGPPPADLKEKGFVQHGFARTSVWELLGVVSETNEVVTVQFGLGPEMVSPQKMVTEAWQNDFTLLLTVELDQTKSQLTTKIEVQNPEVTKSWGFNWLFHTYFRVPEVCDVAVTGLENSAGGVADKVSKSEYSVSSSVTPVTIAGEVDRVYKNVPGSDAVQIVATVSKQPLFTVARTNLDDVVVWNPWTENANALADFSPKTGFHQMLCVEAGTVGRFVTLQPGEKWEASQTLTAHL